MRVKKFNVRVGVEYTFYVLEDEMPKAPGSHEQYPLLIPPFPPTQPTRYAMKVKTHVKAGNDDKHNND